MSLSGKNVLITGASMGIGAAIAHRLAREKATLILVARSEDKLAVLSKELSSAIKVLHYAVDVQDAAQLNAAVEKAVAAVGPIDVLINNAGLALGAPSPFPDLKLEDIATMTATDINGYLFAAHAVLNAGGMFARKAGTILNITSTTALEVPHFPGEAVYHTSKAAQEAFTNVLRTELSGTNIRVLALRPGVVATHFHELRVGYDRGLYEDFMRGMEPLVAEDVADVVPMMVGGEERVSVHAVSVVPTAQRSLQVFDRTWRERNGEEKKEEK